MMSDFSDEIEDIKVYKVVRVLVLPCDCICQRQSNGYVSKFYSCMLYPMPSSTNSELRASVLPYTYPESGSEQYDSMGPNEYYYDPSCYYVPYLPEHSVSSSHVKASES